MSTALLPPAKSRPARPLLFRVRRRSVRIVRRVVWAAQLAICAAVLVGVLGVLAALPVVNLYVLGYLLEAEGRAGRGERWRDVLPWVRFAPRMAALAAGTVLCLLPTLLLADFTRAAGLIDPGGPAAVRFWWVSRCVALLTGLHLFLAYARGGSLATFVRPIKNLRVALARWKAADFSQTIGTRLAAGWQAVDPLRLLWLGLRGLVVALAWLIVPCGMIAAAGPADGPRLLLKVLGLGLLAMLFPGLLILQARLAAEDRLILGLSLRGVLRLFSRAPLAWLWAGATTATLALPLFLFKIIAPPRDALWLLTPLFVAAMLPARIATGWAYRRATTAATRRRWYSIVVAVAGCLAVGLVYSGGVLVAQYINEHGRQAVYEQHAFALPVPF